MANTFFDDEDFQDALIALLCRDVETLKATAHLLTPKDFQPLAGAASGDPYNRWLLAELALSYYNRYHEPLGPLVRSEVLSYAKKMGLEGQVPSLLAYVTQLKKRKLVGVSAILENVLSYKRDYAKAATIEELIDLQAAGELTDEKWIALAQKALAITNGAAFTPTEYFEELETRIERRGKVRTRNPLLMIDPFDAIVRSIGRGHLGLVIAPYKRGKSLFLIWIALAYVLQGLNVIFITLEDPQSDVEDRFDAAVTALPIHKLNALPVKLRKRFARFRRLIKSRLHIFDGTEGGMSTARIEQIYLKERDQGFHADAIIVDYDDEIEPSPEFANKERRFQFADIYRELRRQGAKHNTLMWTAAQTKRGTEETRVLSADQLAEDISKVRKATMAISLGKGDWGDESIYLYVAAHKFDAMHTGCNIMTDKSRMLIYDRDRTAEQMRAAVPVPESGD